MPGVHPSPLFCGRACDCQDEGDEGIVALPSIVGWMFTAPIGSRDRLEEGEMHDPIENLSAQR